MSSCTKLLGVRPNWCCAGALCLAAALAAGALGGNQRAATGVSVLENAPDRVVIQYSIPDLTYTTLQIDGAPYLQVGLFGEAQVLVAGAPDVPHVARSIVIPDSGVMAVRVMDAQYDDLTDIDLAPSKGTLPRTVNPDDVPYTFGAEYGANAFFPGDLAALHEPYILRDCRGVVVDLYPVQYNPVTRTLRVYSSVTVEVVRTAAGGANVLLRGMRTGRPSVSFEKLYAVHFINYVPDQRYNPLSEEGDLLVICYDAWLPNIQPFVDHKNAIGINTTAVGVSTIGNTSTAIKDYIQGVYNQGNLAFVLLVGDAAQVATPSASGGASDPTYSKLAGSDNYPDIMVGRFSAETAAQVDTQVQRSVEYEENAATTLPWFWKGVGIASAQGAGQGDQGQADYVHMDEIRGWLMNMTPPYNPVDQIYDTNGGTAAMVTTALNQGRGIINYCGHGDQTSWGTTGFSNSNVQALQNDNMLPFIVSVACLNGSFNNGTCFAEAWLRSTHNGEPIGAIATYMSSILQDWASPMEAQDEFNILYTQIEPNDYFAYGTLCFAGSCSMMDQYGSTNGSSGCNMFNTWHVFGDPSIRIVGTTIPPHGLAVTPEDEGLVSQGPLGGPFTPGSMDFTLTNRDANAALDYQVTATQNWITINNGVGTIPGGGTATVTVVINAAANNLDMGLYSDTLTFANTTDHTGDTTRPVSLKVGVPTLQYAFPLDSDPGWPVAGEWAFGQPTGQGGGGPYGFPDPTSGYTGPNVYGVNLNGNYSTTYGGPWYVTLGPVDLTGTSEVSVRFQRWLNTDARPYVYAMIEASNDNANWVTIWSNGPQVKDGAWSQKVYDLSAVGTDQPAVWVRWGYQVGNGAFAFSGWNIDDIEIWGLHASGTVFPPGDLNCDHTVDFGDINPFVLALTDPAGYATTYPTCNRDLADINGDGSVNFGDINPFVALLTQ
jgi:hypothetical protein